VQQLEPQPEAASGRDAGSAISLPPLNEVLARDLLAAIEEDRQPLSSGEDGRWALEMITGAHESHLSGARVPLPCPQRENSYVVRRH
jgi:hypothetical protein